MSAPPSLDLLGPLDSDAMLVEASAGTGKTFSIAFLYMRLVAERGFGVDKILVATFTDAATKELKERIRARLIEGRDALLNPDGPAAQDELIAGWLKRLEEQEDLSVPLALRRLRLALVDFDEASISTLHGWLSMRLIRARRFSKSLSRTSPLSWRWCSTMLGSARSTTERPIYFRTWRVSLRIKAPRSFSKRACAPTPSTSSINTFTAR